MVGTPSFTLGPPDPRLLDALQESSERLVAKSTKTGIEAHRYLNCCSQHPNSARPISFNLLFVHLPRPESHSSLSNLPHYQLRRMLLASLIFLASVETLLA